MWAYLAGLRDKRDEMHIPVSVQLIWYGLMKKRSKKQLSVSASEARQAFLQLAQDVATDAVEFVEIAHRDFDERVVLVSRKRLRAWRRGLSALETQLRAPATTEPFRLMGSAALQAKFESL